LKGKTMRTPDFTAIADAHDRIRPYIHRTPALTSSSLNAILGCELVFKCENFQKVGAFKFRGATNAVLSLSNSEAERGVATHSSGNHAAALALAARQRGIPAFVVMPVNAPSIKKRAVESYGAEITYCQPTLLARETTLQRVVEATGATEIHPYNRFEIVAGQGTAVKELIEDCGPFDLILCPVGGGGFLSGTALAAKHLLPQCFVVGCEPAGADDAYRSFISGEIQPSVNPKTIADGLLTSLGTLTFPIIQSHVDQIVTVSEASIVKAMRLIWERMKLVVEPSAAVPLAVLVEGKLDVRNKRVGILLSGGNVDLENLPFKV
jgi:threonine dehydratase